MGGMITRLTTKIENLEEKWLNEKETLAKKNAELNTERDNLAKANVELKDEIADLRHKASEDKSDISRSCYSLIIGDGTLRDVDESKVQENKVIFKDRGNVKEVRDIADRLSDRYLHVTLVTGGEKLRKRRHTTAEEIIRRVQRIN